MPACGADQLLRSAGQAGPSKSSAQLGARPVRHDCAARRNGVSEHDEGRQENAELIDESEEKSSARRFFENWRSSLKWQRLKPYEKFAEMTNRHWDGIAAYCKPENKLSLGFVEGLNNKIRVIQHRA